MAEIFDTLLIVVHVMLVIVLIALVLLQKSEGGALGIGGGGGGGFMSARGAASALTKATAFIAAAFFLTSVLLGISAKNATGPSTILNQIQNTGVPIEERQDPDAPTSSAGSLLDDLNEEGSN